MLQKITLGDIAFRARARAHHFQENKTSAYCLLFGRYSPLYVVFAFIIYDLKNDVNVLIVITKKIISISCEIYYYY